MDVCIAKLSRSLLPAEDGTWMMELSNSIDRHFLPKDDT